MQSISDIQKRIKSVSNTKQITKAMEVVSATKMRKSQELALSARSYAISAFELLAGLERNREELKLPALFQGNKSKKTLLVVMASDKGLAGSLNSNILKKSVAFREKALAEGAEMDVVVVGKKSRDYFAHRDIPTTKTFLGHGDYIDFDQVKELSEFLKQEFLEANYHKIVFAYTNFLSTLKQEAVIRQVLPLSEKGLRDMVEGLLPKKGKYSEEEKRVEKVTDYLFEPTREEVFNNLVDRLFQMEIYHITLEANASEHSARMVAMKTASENADDIVKDLTLVFNKRRQAKITQEIVEITSGSDAIT